MCACVRVSGISLSLSLSLSVCVMCARARARVCVRSLAVRNFVIIPSRRLFGNKDFVTRHTCVCDMCALWMQGGVFMSEFVCLRVSACVGVFTFVRACTCACMCVYARARMCNYNTVLSPLNN